MPSTYELIKGETISSTATSYGFTAIPSTYTDLVIRASLRSVINQNTIQMKIQFNTYDPAFGSNTNHSRTRIMGTGAAASSARNSDREAIFAGEMNGSTSTSNTFTSVEFYLPNYASSSMQKPASTNTAFEANATTAYITATASLYDITTAISAIYLMDDGSPDGFASGSSFYLYGIRSN